MAYKPCCTAAAARKTKQLLVGEHLVGLDQLDEIMSEVAAMHLQDRTEISEALLRKVKIFNYVPSEAGPQYKRALLDEYARRGGNEG